MNPVRITALLDASISDQELAHCLHQKAFELSGKPDDAGADWYTDHHGRTYIAGDPRWCVSKDPFVALFIDTAHALTGSSGDAFKISDTDLERAQTDTGAN